MAFTISVLSVLVSVSGAGGGKNHVRQRSPLIFVHIRLTRPYFCISSSVACRALWPFLLCNKNKYRCIINIYHTKNSLHRGDRTELLLFPNKVGLNYTATVPL